MRSPDPHHQGSVDSPLALLARAARLASAAPALHAGAVRLTYAELAHAVARLAAQFRHELGGPSAGHGTILLLLRNGAALPIAIHAAQAAGGSVCALNPDYSGRELSEILSIARPALAITHADLAEHLHAALPAGFGGSVVALPPDEPAWVSALLSGDRPADLPLPNPDGIAVIQFTGGTTGRPKGVMLRHRALAANVAQREAILPTSWAAEHVICMMPLFHSFASAMGLLLCANAAGCLHVLPRYRPDWVVDMIRTEAITLLPAGPTVFNSLLRFDDLDRAALTSVRAAYSGSAPLSRTTLDEWEERTGIPIYEGYGQSEAGPVLTYHGPAMARKPGSVGPALPATELRIVQPESGQDLPTGEAGEIWARGPQLMEGYLADPDATANALQSGWLRTGDVGRLDEDGYLFIEDRLKDMVISSGYNIYPREIDEQMMACPGVREAAAIGVPDSYRGELVWAFYSGTVTPPALTDWLAERLVAYKRPARLVPLPDLPRTPVGKLDKPALRAIAAGMGAAA